MARPAARGLGFHQARQILRHDHSEGIWRAWLLALCAFGSGAEDLVTFGDRRRDRDGAELARPRGTPYALWHQGPTSALVAAPCPRTRGSLPCIYQSGGRP